MVELKCSCFRANRILFTLFLFTLFLFGALQVLFFYCYYYCAGFCVCTGFPLGLYNFVNALRELEFALFVPYEVHVTRKTQYGVLKA